MEAPLYLDNVMQFFILYTKTTKNWNEEESYIKEQ
jgi:hypothetical protein